jgi:hypothetical protein
LTRVSPVSSTSPSPPEASAASEYPEARSAVDQQQYADRGRPGRLTTEAKEPSSTDLDVPDERSEENGDGPETKRKLHRGGSAAAREAKKSTTAAPMVTTGHPSKENTILTAFCTVSFLRTWVVFPQFHSKFLQTNIETSTMFGGIISDCMPFLEEAVREKKRVKKMQKGKVKEKKRKTKTKNEKKKGK